MPNTEPKKAVHVAVAVIENAENQILIAKRPGDKHLGGLWEFPGGKVEAGESVEIALKRELLEEVNLEVDKLVPLIQIPWQYESKAVFLDVFSCKPIAGVARGCENQEVRWISRQELHHYHFPPANKGIVNALTLPNKLLITGKCSSSTEFFSKFDKALSSGINLIQIRDFEALTAHPESLFEQFKHRYFKPNANLEFFLNASPELCISCGFNYLHLKSKFLVEPDIAQRISNFARVSASVHNEYELELANTLKLDFILVSPVANTLSHPGVKPMGWEKFGYFVTLANMPVFALGGLNELDIEKAKSYGAQGVAAISAFW